MSDSTRSVNAIRALAIDATEAAGSGHPGMPMGTAAVGYSLFRHIMHHNPKNPNWWNRDRYIQSAGHGSMLIYSLLHLSGYALSMDELRHHRQWGSITPGHPELHLTPGVEMTTGPLGQGLATSVGFALAEAHLAAVYNKPDFELFNYHTYVIASDGDMMEGVTAEAGSLAAHWGLGKLIVLYDDNLITLDAAADVSMTEDVLARYNAYGWHTSRVADGNDVDAIIKAVDEAKAVSDKPSLIAVRTIIGFGATGQGSSKVHGSALGEKGAKEAKDNLNIDWPAFSVPDDVKADYAEIMKAGSEAEANWNKLFEAYKAEYPDLASQLERIMSGEVPAGLETDMPVFAPGSAMATRNASGKAINFFGPRVPELVGGSADLSGSTKTTMDKESIFQKDNPAGRNVFFGVREHAMAAIVNGMTISGLRGYAGTFLMFADYLRPSLRLAALMDTPSLYVFTHDSIGVGGDGPTHQPIASVMSLRVIPNLLVFRPADANETMQAWAFALKHSHGPVAFILSRQDLPNLNVPAGSVEKGAYILADSEGAPEALLIGTGSEVQWCLEAKAKLDADGIPTRVVSMPSMELFDKQDQSYRETILPDFVKARVAIEAGATLGWYKYVGLEGAVIGIDKFGASADGDKVMEEYGISASNLVKTVKGLIKRQG
ncbi:MAG: transketolase [Trueperaceae bacterium]|nr:transketolase [Trueperaceae bacterium]